MSKAKYEEDLWKRVVRPKTSDRRPSFISQDDLRLDFYDILKAYLMKTRDIKRITLEEKVEALEKEIQKLKQKNPSIEKMSKADMIYELFREELEEKYFGKIVAIDINGKKIVGVGRNVLEAYKDALKNSNRSSFSYKKVGYPYVYKLR